MGMKRGRESRGSTNKSKKKQRVEKVSSSTHADADETHSLGIDELNWKEVQLPDRLEDAEGFFGLEEIEGVDIVRAEGHGEIRFKPAGNTTRKSLLEKSTTSESDENNVAAEWSGFSDEDSTPGDAQLQSKADETDITRPVKEKKKKGKSERKQTENRKEPKSGIQPNVSFAALHDDQDDGVDVSAWDPLGLSPSVQTGLSQLTFSSPTTIQEAAIPEIIAGHDVVGKASTGSGKTLAFGIPILEHYLERRGQTVGDEKTSEPIALILSPTRELAHQIAKHIGELNTHTPDANARIALLTGGLSIQKQQRLLAEADIVIGTPGRVWEILSTGHGLIKKMKKIRYLVVDEADRLLSDGHFKEMEEIVNTLDGKHETDFPEQDRADDQDAENAHERQTLVFSATFHKGLQQKLAGKGKFMSNDLMDKNESMEYLLKKLNFRDEKPKFIDVNPVSQMAEGLKEGIVECAAMEKDLYLYTLLLYHPGHRTLVFTNSISSVRRLAQFLQHLGIPALALHSNMEQKARLRSVERFASAASNSGSVLVATDVAARGLDIKGIDFVIHYHVPRAADMYVHRSGRTARAGALGKSVLICAPDEVIGVARLVSKVHVDAQSTKVVKRNPLESLELDRRIVSRVKPRVALAKRITESALAKEKISAEDNWLRNAAEELGVDYDSEEFEQQGVKAKGRGRGGGRSKQEKKAGSVTKAEMAGMKAELKEMLSKRINIGVSERYITAGRVDIDALLRGDGNNEAFIGLVDKLEF